MALIYCFNCGKQISDKAIECVHCGVQLNQTKTKDDSPIVWNAYKPPSRKSYGLRIFIRIAIFIAILVVFGLATGNPEKFSAIFDNIRPKHDYPAETTQNFMNWCLISGGSQQECSCALDKIQRKYSFEKFKGIERTLLYGQPTTGFIEFVNKAKENCRGK